MCLSTICAPPVLKKNVQPMLHVCYSVRVLFNLIFTSNGP